MDQYLSTVIIAIITGVFGIVTAIINKKNNEVIDKIDEQSRLAQKEKELKKKLLQKEKDLNELNNTIRLLILDTNLYIINHMNLEGGTDPAVLEKAENLKRRYDEIAADIEKIKTEYNAISEVNNSDH